MNTTHRILFSNVRIADADTSDSGLKTILVENGIISAILDMSDTPSGNYEIIDCGGNFMLPGFVDAHLHIPGDLLYAKFGVLLYDCCSMDELLSFLAEKRNSMKTYSCIRGYGWNYDIFSQHDGIYRDRDLIRKLDDLFPHTPAVLYSSDYHSCICNTCALNICGISEKSFDPAGGTIVKDREGLPNGLLLENACHLINRHPELCFSHMELEDAIDSYQAILHRNGITSVQTLMFIGGNYSDEWKILEKLNRENRLKININGSVPISPGMSAEQILSDIRDAKQYENDKIQIRTAKLYMDGVIENYTASLFRPYSDSGKNCACLWESEELKSVCAFLQENNMQLHAHAIGDRAVSLAASAFAFAQTKAGKSDCRNTIAHIQLCDMKTVRKMARHHIIACLQPFWFPASPSYFSIDRKRLGRRADYEYRLNSFIRNGVLVSGGSDSPVTVDFCPTIAISYGAARTDKDCSWPLYNRKERAGIPELIRAFTTAGAYQLFRENSIGAILPGYYADFVLLPKNICHMDAADIKDVRPVMTVFRGEVVYPTGEA